MKRAFHEVHRPRRATRPTCARPPTSWPWAAWPRPRGCGACSRELGADPLGVTMVAGKSETMIPVDRALEIVLAHTRPLPAEDVLLERRGGPGPGRRRRLRPGPAALRPRRDGRLRAASGGRRRGARTLVVAGQIRAGQHFDGVLQPGQAVQIMTGAPVPPGADAVQQVEKTRAARRRPRGGDPGRPWRRAPTSRASGCEVRARARPCCARASRSIPRRSRCSPRSGAGACASAAGRRCRSLVTGDELVDVWDMPGRGQIRNSNGHAGAGQARWAGAEVRSLGTVPDQAERIAAARARGPRGGRARDLRRRVGGRLRPGGGGAGALRRGLSVHEGRDQARRARWSSGAAATRWSSACPATPCPPR